jgi:predicted DNA-binding antitoxin AbrB/MazE fold protein
MPLTVQAVFSNGVLRPQTPLTLREGEIVEITISPPVAAEAEMEARVVSLLKRWRSETAYLSSSTAILGHPAYRELIQLGPRALPSLLRDLEKTEDGHLSKALSDITGAQPIPPEERGHIRKIAQTWLRWAKENGHRW